MSTSPTPSTTAGRTSWARSIFSSVKSLLAYSLAKSPSIFDRDPCCRCRQLGVVDRPRGLESSPAASVASLAARLADPVRAGLSAAGAWLAHVEMLFDGDAELAHCFQADRRIPRRRRPVAEASVLRLPRWPAIRARWWQGSHDTHPPLGSWFERFHTAIAGLHRWRRSTHAVAHTSSKRGDRRCRRAEGDGTSTWRCSRCCRVATP